jgi:hypothetical protein
MRAKSRQLNQTIYDETYGTNVWNEIDEIHERAGTLVAKRTWRTA